LSELQKGEGGQTVKDRKSLESETTPVFLAMQMVEDVWYKSDEYARLKDNK